MHISDVHDYDGSPHEEKVREFMSEGSRKQIKSAIEQIVEEEFDRLEEYGGEYISQIAAHRAEKFLERVLDGDKDAALELLGDKSGGSRYRSCGYDEGKPWASLIHGKLYDTNPIALRKRIVEAHADLLRNERIKDLESQVEGLSQQIRELSSDLERAYDRSRLT